jgi:hypothetical protein
MFVPDTPMFRQNTGAFVHELLPAGAIANVDGDYVRVQVLTNTGALDRGGSGLKIFLCRIMVGEARDTCTCACANR